MRMGVRVAVAAALVLLGTAAPAGAHDGLDRVADLAPVVDLGPARELQSGIYEVALRTGPPLLTHGPDGRAARAAAASEGPERPPVCASSDHLRVLYGRPVTQIDRSAEVLDQIESVIWQMNGRLDRAAQESGGMHADYRVQCDTAGDLRVDGFANVRSASFADVVDAARLAGATSENADYLIFYDDPSPDACGTGTYEPDDRLAPDNRNNAGGGYAVIYADCWDSSTAMHEVGHTQGAVQASAPNSTGSGGHCRDETDVMCYDDGGDLGGGLVERCDAPEAFDCGYDDYFDVAPLPGEYLATHWNLGSPLNRFIWLSELSPDEDPAYGECDPVLEECDAPPTDARAVVRIVRGEFRRGARRVNLVLACPASRESECTGSVLLRHRGRGTVGRRVFSLHAGERGRVGVRVARRARRSLAASGGRRLRIVVREPGLATTARRMAMR